MAQRGRAKPLPARTNTPQTSARAGGGRASGLGAAFLILCAIVIAGIVPVFWAGQLLGLWHVDIPFGFPSPFPSPTPTLMAAHLTAHLTALRACRTL